MIREYGLYGDKSQGLVEIPVLQSWEEAMDDLDASEQEFERGEFVSGDEFAHACKSLIGHYSKAYAY